MSRHPLFGALLYPGACLNDWLMGWTHHNCATFIMAVMLVISATFSAVFFFRICRELIQLCRLDAYILTAFFFSFASIMLTTMVPDHFCFSMLCLLVSIYMVGTCMAQGKQLKAWQASLLFLTTAGVSLSNGVKTGIMSLFCNGRKVFSPRFFAIAFILPLLIMGGSFYYQNEYIVKPQQEKGKEIERKLMPKRPDIAQKNAVHDAWMDAHRGKSVSDMPFLKWTDVSTPRMESIVENLFGEGIQLHQKELLKDLSVSRPTFIRYDWAISYIFEAFVFLLFAAGVFYSRHSRLMWMSELCGIRCLPAPGARFRTQRGIYHGSPLDVRHPIHHGLCIQRGSTQTGKCDERSHSLPRHLLLGIQRHINHYAFLIIRGEIPYGSSR